MPDTKIAPLHVLRALVRAGLLDPLRPGRLVRLKRDADRWGPLPAAIRAAVAAHPDRLGLASTRPRSGRRTTISAGRTRRSSSPGCSRPRTRGEWEQDFGGCGACVTPVLSPWETHLHPHHLARHAFLEGYGRMLPAPAPRFSHSHDKEHP